jgi:hypothetical protein
MKTEKGFRLANWADISALEKASNFHRTKGLHQRAKTFQTSPCSQQEGQQQFLFDGAESKANFSNVLAAGAPLSM